MFHCKYGKGGKLKECAALSCNAWNEDVDWGFQPDTSNSSVFVCCAKGHDGSKGGVLERRNRAFQENKHLVLGLSLLQHGAIQTLCNEAWPDGCLILLPLNPIGKQVAAN